MSRDILCALIDADPGQPRKHFDAAALGELAQSIAASGLAVPILVRPAGDRFLIVHGERRFRAVQSLGWESIPAEVREMSAEDARWLAIAENVQRSDLTPIEEAQAYQAVLSEGITQTELGRRLGKSQSYIAQKLRLLKLSDDVLQALSTGQLSEGHARQLLRLGRPAEQVTYFKIAQSVGLSVSRLSWYVDSYLEKPGAEAFWMGETFALERRLESAETLKDVLAVQREALRLHNEYAEVKLGLQRMAGKAITDLESITGAKGLKAALKEAELMIDISIKSWALSLGEAFRIRGNTNGAKWRGLSDGDAQYLVDCAAGAQEYDARRVYSLVNKTVDSEWFDALLAHGRDVVEAMEVKTGGLG